MNLMPHRRRYLGGLAVALGLAVFPNRLAAQGQTAPVYQWTTYVWAAGAGGTIQPIAGGPVLTIDRSFSDLQEDLNAAFFLSGLVRSGRVLFVGDLSYFAMTRQGQVPVPGVGAVPAAGRLEQTSFTLEGGYRLLDEQAGTVELLAGVRTWWLRADVTVPGTPATRSDRRQFTDPIVALRGNARLSPRLSVLGYIDGGGFGVGSDATLQLVGTLNFQLNTLLYLSAGYRQLSVDYSEGGSRIDITSGGPLFGLTFRF